VTTKAHFSHHCLEIFQQKAQKIIYLVSQISLFDGLKKLKSNDFQLFTIIKSGQFFDHQVFF
jgi:hypothetical protein